LPAHGQGVAAEELLVERQAGDRCRWSGLGTEGERGEIRSRRLPGASDRGIGGLEDRSLVPKLLPDAAKRRLGLIEDGRGCVVALALKDWLSHQNQLDRLVPLQLERDAERIVLVAHRRGRLLDADGDCPIEVRVAVAEAELLVRFVPGRLYGRGLFACALLRFLDIGKVGREVDGQVDLGRISRLIGLDPPVVLNVEHRPHAATQEVGDLHIDRSRGNTCLLRHLVEGQEASSTDGAGDH
jgi:hypothetical protein